MFKRVLVCILCIICLVGCKNSSNGGGGSSSPGSYTPSTNSSVQKSSFSIQFIDVKHGDAALIECDGKYMLIDGGETTAADALSKALSNVTELEILAISHNHSDHMGGLVDGLGNIMKINKAISNSDRPSLNSTKDASLFTDLQGTVMNKGTEIKVARKGDKYKLGSADVEIIFSDENADNDGSLVILITYGENRFLFTGDIENRAQKEICSYYENEDDEEFKIDVLKMPHHGSYVASLYNFIRTFMPDYFVISNSESDTRTNLYSQTINTLESYKKANISAKVCTTYENGDIFVSSDGKKVSVSLSKGNYS